MIKKKSEGKYLPQLKKKPKLEEFEKLIFECFLLFGHNHQDVKAFCEFNLIDDPELRLYIFLICKAVAGSVESQKPKE